MEGEGYSNYNMDDDTIDDVEDESNNIDELFSFVCSFCDDGGKLLSCEGRCLRSFHPTVEAGEGSGCRSLGFKQSDVDAMPTFLCKNCRDKKHQCYACGELGSSDRALGAEVFPCASAICGRFYHPCCVAKLLCQDNGVSAEGLQKKISMGDYFTCPIHKCCVCQEGENKKDHELQLAVCMRCPKSYHRKCLPREIGFEDSGGRFGEGRSVKRAWDKLLPNRILIYCTKHAINKDTGCASGDHIKFPDLKVRLKTRKLAIDKDTGCAARNHIKFPDPKVRLLKLAEKRRKLTSVSPVGREKVLSKQMNISSEDLYRERTAPTPTVSYVRPKPSYFVEDGNPDSPAVDSERLLALMKNATSSISLEDVIQKHTVPSTHAFSSKVYVKEKILLGKVEHSTEAMRTALRKLEEGCSIEDAEAVCDRDVLHQICMWKKKLDVYLAPFLCGMCYTSFGRHFTKVDKLEQIVDRLHWYVQDKDMIVDFSCGANDFSILMNKKLEETGKKNCLYKNYDLFQPEKDFNFVKKDWMTVCRDEDNLPTGSRLIIGLNPPFGSKAVLANKFINKALEFQPKLIILIVPAETQRLDEKKSPYELVWEDDELLAGKSFYLPGSVDVNDNQMEQWNMRAPPLYLWSHPRWAAFHRDIAQTHGHSFGR